MPSKFSTTCDCLSYDLKPKNNMQIHSRSRPKHKFVSWQNTVNQMFIRRTRRARLTFITVLLSFAILISFVFIFLQLRIQEGKKKEKKGRRRRRGRGGGRAWSSRANLQVQNWVLKLENSSLEFKIESSNSKLNPYVQNWYPEFKSESSNSKNPKKPEVEKLKSGVREWIIKPKNWTLKLKIKALNSRPNLGW